MFNARSALFIGFLLATFRCSAELTIPNIEIGRLMTTPESRVEIAAANKISTERKTAVNENTGGESARKKPVKVFGVVTSDNGDRHVWINQPGKWQKGNKDTATALAHTEDSVLISTTQGKVQVKVGHTLKSNLTTVESYLNPNQ